ncbi:MAG: FAD-dependent oxidoreductase [Candidatus Omnitrophica bacterium]|nr:FAD-dependent oxidoreductase [Candidatus Omnitrophota bacterium]
MLIKVMEKIDITVVGAGIIGLAVAYELSKDYKDIFIIEKNSSFGQETSSRNSEVIHAGIYYPKDSLKTKTCIEGRHLLYEFCEKNDIPHKKIGKLIVAIDKMSSEI